ncbi:LCP family protein [Specibacter sp. NPDC057265]|uniref:LCP family protein n=1 Tax=Specibacter sp. NPDC057265 TaxID=3346075 RepID=UPI0036263FF7
MFITKGLQMGRRRAEPGPAVSSRAPRRRPAAGDEPVGRHFKSRPKAPLWLRITALTMSAVLVLGLMTAAVLFIKLQSNVTTAPLNAGIGNKSSDQASVEDTGSLQILILGTDTRDGENSQYGTSEDSGGVGNSDVMLLMDISADNSRVSVTSFPRDLMVPIPDCSAENGDVVPGAAFGQLNAALQAGPGCTVSAINDITGLRIDHFMLADFTAVKELSNALGGVEVCVDHAMYDVDGSWLKLPEGKSLVQGEQALAFLRTRHAFGDASDLERIKAQQFFLASMVRKVKSEETLTNLPKLYTLADVVTKNLTIDEGLGNIPAMTKIATRLAKINLANVAFVTVPTTTFTGDANRVQLLEPDAGQFFAALRNDTPLTDAPASPEAPAPGEDATTESTTPAPESTPPPVPAPAYDKGLQAVSVTNASAVVGRSIELLQALAANGYSNSWQAGDVPVQGVSEISHGPGMADVAADIAALFGIPASAVREDPAVAGVNLLVGSDWGSGTKYGEITVPEDIVASTADEAGQCLVVNPAYYD